MLSMIDLRDVFRKKLAASDSIDAAFTKACWIAYQEGFKNGKYAFGQGTPDLFDGELPILHSGTAGDIGREVRQDGAISSEALERPRLPTPAQAFADGSRPTGWNTVPPETAGLPENGGRWSDADVNRIRKV